MSFINDDPVKAASLVAQIQKLQDSLKNKNLRTFVVFISGPESKEALQRIASEKKISVPLAFLPQGKSQRDYGYYKINPEAKNTIMVYNRQQVQATFVNVDEKSFADVAKAAEAMLN